MTKYWAMSTAKRKKLLGSTEAEVRKHLVKRVWKGKTFLIHSAALKRFDNAVAAIALYEKKYKKNYVLHVAYSFCWRRIAGSLAMSNHAFGIAFDINPAQNPMRFGKLKTDIPSYIVRAFEDQGFRWGGRYTVRKDAMHFEA